MQLEKKKNEGKSFLDGENPIRSLGEKLGGLPLKMQIVDESHRALSPRRLFFAPYKDTQQKER
jgi:hypothetical protein